MRRLILSLALLFATTPLVAAVSGSLIDTDGQPVAGAKVSVFAPESYDARRARLESKTPDRTPLVTTTSNARGIFSFDPPKLPVYVIQVDASGFAPALSEAAAGDELGTVALTKAETTQGKVTADGKPVANALVSWIGGGGAEVTVHTDAQGHYSVPDPAKWAQRELVLHPDFAMYAKVITPLEKNITGDVTLTPGVALAGGVVAEDGQTPVAKATIRIFGFDVATTGDDGRFQIAHAPKQWDTLTAVAGDRLGSVTQASKGTTIRLTKGAFITGSVRDTKAQVPLVAAAVVANVGGRGLPFATPAPSSAITDAKGNFSIGPIVAGAYNLSMQRPGYAGSNAAISLLPGQKVSRALVAVPVARVSGVVVDENRAPVAGALVVARESGRGGRMGFMPPMAMMQLERTAWTGADGRFSAVAVEGDAQIEAVKKGWPAARSATMHLVAGERKSGVVITVPRGVEVTGKVVDQNGKPVSGVAVVANEAEQGPGGPMAFARRVVMRAMNRDAGDTTVRTAADGTFTLRVKEGLYDFGFQHTGYSQNIMRAQQVSASTKPLSVTLEPSVAVTGRVMRGSTPIAGAMVFVGGGPAGEAAQTITAADGSFRLDDLTAGQMMLVVMKQDEMVQTMKPVSAPAKDVLIDLPSTSRVSGRVVDKATNKPITTFEAGVTIPRGGGGMMIMMPPMMQTFTSDDGSFTLENVPVGETQIVANAPGYTMARVSTTVEQGKAVTGVEIGLQAGAKLTGRVTGPDGAPLAGVVVRPETNGPRNVIRAPGGNDTATTDANGEYSIDSLEPGDHSITFNYASLPPLSKSVTLSDKETRLDVQFTNGVRLTGVVVTEGGAPVADAQVRANSAAEGGFGVQARSDASGTFIFEGLAPGHYTISAMKSGYAEGMLHDVDIAGGAPVRVTLKSGGVIYGHVSGLSASEMGQATVSAMSSNGNASAAVDSSGNYRIEGAPTGNVRVQANTGMGMSGGRTAPAKVVQVDSGTVVQADIEFPSTTTVRGRITRAGSPLDGSFVSFFPRGGGAQTNARTQTQSDGSYSVTGLDDGTYNVQITDIGRGISYTTHYDVHGSGTFDVDMKLTSVRGHAVDTSTGQPLDNVTIELRSSSGGGPFMGRPAMTDSNGYYSIDSVAPGSYQASASKDGYGNSLQDVSVSDSALDLDFKLTPQAGVVMTVLDARDRTVLAPNVRVYDMSGRDVTPDRFNFGAPAGPVKLALSPGTYRAFVSAQGYAPQTVTITSPSQPVVMLTPGGTIVIHNRNNTATRGRLLGPDGTPAARFGNFTLNAPPLTTVLSNVASATYTLQLLDATNQVVGSTTVTVVDGGTADVTP